MRKPDDKTPSHGPEVPADTSSAELAASSGSEAPLLDGSETGTPGQAESVLRQRRTGKVSIDAAARSSTRPLDTGTSRTPVKSTPVATADAPARANASTMQPPVRHPRSQAPEGRRSGGPWTQGAPIARDTALSTRVHAASDDGGHSRTARTDAEDPDEIDVSDQLDEFADAGASSDLAYEDLIIEEEEDDEDEDTSISVSAWGAASGTARAARVPHAGDPRHDARPERADARGARQELEEDTSGFAARLGSEPEPTSRAEAHGTPVIGETPATKQTLVEDGTVFEGTLQSSYPVVVNGTIDGQIDAPMLSIGTSGVIVGVIKSETLHSQGKLSGNIDAREVFLSGTIVDKTVIKARRLELKLESSEKSWVNLTFRIGNFEPDDVGSELRPSGMNAAEHDESDTSAR